MQEEQIILAAFTETTVRGHADEEKINASAKMISIYLKSWSGSLPLLSPTTRLTLILLIGLLYLNLNGRQAIAALIDSLKSPSQTVRVGRINLSDLIFTDMDT